MSKIGRVRTFMASLDKEIPDFDLTTPYHLEKTYGRWLLHRIECDPGPNPPRSRDRYALYCGWELLFPDGRSDEAWTCRFDLSEVVFGHNGAPSDSDNSSKEAFAASSERLRTRVHGKILPFLSQFDSLEKLVAAYDHPGAASALPEERMAKPTPFRSRGAYCFGESPCWRRFNLGFALAEVRRPAEAITHLEALLKEFPANPELEWMVEREAAARAKLDACRRVQ